MSDTPDADAVADFVLAVAADEYAELELSTGDVLITDWEGDGVFNPYVVPGEATDHRDGRNPHDPDTHDAIADAIRNALGVPVRRVEYSTRNDAFYPSIPKGAAVGENYLRAVRQVE